MTADDLDDTYTELCRALGRVGQAQAPLLLAMFSLALLARDTDAAAVRALIAQAEALCQE